MRIITFLLSVLIWAACGSDVEVDDSKVFRLNRYENVSSMDPAFARNQTNTWVCNQLYNSLVQLDDDLEIQPDLAKKWEISNQGLTYTFHLRDDVKFHKHPVFGKDSTRTVVAEDFVYSFDRLRDEKVASPGGWVLSSVKDYQALNDSTFQINLKENFPPFLGLLSMKYCSVVPKEMFAKGQEAFNKHPIGTGPFKFKITEDSVKLVLRKNNLYFEKDEEGNSLPYLEAVVFTFLPEQHAEFLQLIQGKADFLQGIHPSYKDELLDAHGKLKEKYQDQLVQIEKPYLVTNYLCFNQDTNPTHLYLRKAIGYGIDRSKIITYLKNGLGTEATGGIIPKGLPSFDASIGFSFQPKKALELVKSYEKETGKEATVTLTTISKNQELAEFIQGELAKIGLDFKINIITASALREGRGHGKFQIFEAGWIADYPDGENFLSLFYSENFAPDGPNYSHFKNAKFDALYRQAKKEVNTETRNKMYLKMDQLMIKEAPIVPLFHDQVTVFIRKEVKNFTINSVKKLNLKKVKKE